jgi:hypothetical protein
MLSGEWLGLQEEKLAILQQSSNIIFKNNSKAYKVTCDHYIAINITLNAIYSETGHYKVYSAVCLDKRTEDLRKRKEQELGNHYAIK